MPSDVRTPRVLEALAEARDRYRSAVSTAHDQMAGYLATHRARTHGHAQVVARDLGKFAVGRIDAERFGALFSETRSLASEVVERVERLVGVLAELLAEGDELFIADVPPGGNLRDTVERAVAHAGRAFGAVSAFQALKNGEYRPERHDPAVLSLPFARWNRRERVLAPPLVVEVDGADVRAEALSEYMDGRMAIALVVRGAASPAPLARLIAPGTFVVQTTEPDDLRTVIACDCPVVVALVTRESATFTHDPRAGRSLQVRLRVTSTPSDAPRNTLGWRSAWQQHEELAHLQLLAGVSDEHEPARAARTAAERDQPALTPDARSPSPDAQAVDRLTNWLLAESGLAAGEPIGVGGTR
jgi:hypothetical protein